MSFVFAAVGPSPFDFAPLPLCEMAAQRERDMRFARVCVNHYLVMDWMTRHEHLYRLLNNRPRIYELVVALMSPADLIHGTNTGIQAQTVAPIIALPDGALLEPPRRRGRQMQMCDYMRRVARRH